MRRQVSLFVTGGALLGLLQAGCDGSYDAPSVPDGGSTASLDGGPNAGGSSGAGGKRDGGTGGTGGAIMVRTKPVPAAVAKKLAAGQVELVGSTASLSSCSQQMPPAGDRWCAFYQPGDQLGTVELWVVNATKAASDPVKCDGSDPSCKRLTADLWTGTPSVGPSHPESHRFTGDTLIFYAGAPVTADVYRGKVWAWRPGWGEARAITDNAGVLCFAHPRAAVAACLGNLPTNAQDAFAFDLYAGPLVDGANSVLPKVDHIFPNTENGETKWSADFSPSGDLFGYSTGVSDKDAQVLFVMKSNETGDPTKRIKIAEPARGAQIGGAAEFQFASDSSRVFYLRDYDPDADLPQGTLVSADTATGQTRSDLLANVVAFSALGDATTLASRGVAIYHDVKSTGATFSLLRDPANPAGIVKIVDGVADVVISKDQRFAYYVKAINNQTGLTDAWVTELEGTPTPCALQKQLRTASFGPPFSDDSSLAFWVDNVDPNTFTGEGWLANASDCSSPMKYADAVDYWFTGGRRFVYSHDTKSTWATLSYATLGPDGKWPATGPVKVQEGVDRAFTLVQPNLDVALFTFATNFPDVNGLYAVRLGAVAPGVDGGVTDAAQPVVDAGADAP